ncbi:MAG: ABC transporter permease [Halieaceae bacterium]|nr:ABC transporter permease [Halieaceae bacterium]MCP5147177.1 ABC transporter permease [Pseudomonadales bacterium]MCP5168041.1 ABC transporter permease [Pseudomonadales bacterium]MCP5188412.1 ABC transporter permease [Pseudomonadales bacterium]
MSFVQYLRLADTMARMSLRAEASRYFLGYIWWILEPMLWVAVFYVVFEVLLQAGRADFLVFLMCGKLAFIWFSKSVNQAANSIVMNRGLVGRINVTKTLFPLAVVQEGLYRQAAVFLLLFCVLFAWGYTPSLAWFYVVPVIVVNYLMIVACAYIGACLVCLVRDFSMIISLGMTFLLFTSGIFWDVRHLPDPALTELVLAVNPLAFILDAYRQVLMFHTPPAWMHLLWVGCGAVALLLLMVVVMRRNSQYLALKALS